MRRTPREIQDGELELSDMPGENPGFDELSRFALTLPGPLSVRRIGPGANRARDAWERTGELPSDLRELRECLFFEQRRQRHFNSGPGGSEHPSHEAVSYMRALVEAIRVLVAERRTA